MHKNSISHDQHFMVDPEAVKTLVSLARISREDTVLEIGAGTGLLTELLAARAGKVVAVEIDRQLGIALKKKYRNRNVQVLIGNGLDLVGRIDFDVLISNIPYSITEPLFRKLLPLSFKRAVLTVPKKFAYRLIPGKGNKSALSSWCSLFFTVKIARELPKSAFNPPPKTNSVILTLEPAPPSFVKKVFSMRTSKTKNALREALCKQENTTKNEARKTIKSLNLTHTILETRIGRLDLKQSEHLLKSLQTIRQ